MGFFQDLKQDLSQTVNDLAVENTSDEISLDNAEEAAEDLFKETQSEETLDIDVAAMLDNIDSNDNIGGSTSEETFAESAENNLGVENTTNEYADDVFIDKLVEETEAVEDVNKNDIETDNITSEVDDTMDSMEELLNEVELNIEEPSFVEEKITSDSGSFETDMAVSSDTAVITSGMTINGDITSSGNMDLIGSVTGNIDILGKLNVTGNITGNSSAAEIYAESAQINGEVRSKGSVKIGQSSVVIGDIFATSAVIAGAVKGDIDVQGPVILDTSAIVMGNIKSKSVQINNGAVIEGMCSQCYADVSPTSFFNDVKKNRK
jgi:cytoskeletal protein CcmA (bactofilin family)